ncbi:MAG: hypothetical protein ACRCW2_10335 [Cellulosilyticaceae bacterium]
MRKQKNNTKTDIYELDQLLNFKNLDTSYKLFWLKGILDEVQTGAQKIPFQKLAIRMIAESWEYVVERGVQFSREDRLHRIVEEVQGAWNISGEITKDEVVKTLENLWDRQLEHMIEELYEDTPYRFFEPLYAKEVKGKKERDKNIFLEEKINQSNNLLYKIDRTNKMIQIDKDWAIALKSKAQVVEGIYRDNLAYLLRDAGLGKSIRYSLK